MKEPYEHLLETLDIFEDRARELQDAIRGPKTMADRQLALSRTKHQLGAVEDAFLLYAASRKET